MQAVQQLRYQSKQQPLRLNSKASVELQFLEILQRSISFQRLEMLKFSTEIITSPKPSTCLLDPTVQRS